MAPYLAKGRQNESIKYIFVAWFDFFSTIIHISPQKPETTRLTVTFCSKKHKKSDNAVW